MCFSTLFGFFVGIVLFKVLRRLFFWRMGYGGCGPCGCRRFAGSWGGRDRDGHGGCDGDRWQRDSRWRSAHYGQSYGQGYATSGGGNDSAGGAATSGRPLDELVRGLELNERQAAEAAPVFAIIKERLGTSGPRVETALQILSADRFDPSPLAAQLGELPGANVRELLDGLEHLHTILISEQREQLKRELQRR